MDAKVICVPYVLQWPYFVACNLTIKFFSAQRNLTLYIVLLCTLLLLPYLSYSVCCLWHRNLNCLYKGLHYHTYCILLSNHCRIAPFPFSFTLRGSVPGAAQTERCSHPVLLRLRLPAFLFLCHIHLGSGSGPGEPSVMQKLSRMHADKGGTDVNTTYIWQTLSGRLLFSTKIGF